MKKRRKGFTLIELLTVILVLGIITSLAVVNFNNNQKNSKEILSKVTFNSISEATISYVEEYKKNQNWYKDENNDNEKYICIKLKQVIDKGFLGNKLINSSTGEEIDTNSIIKVVKNKNEVIDSVSLVNSDECSAMLPSITTPDEEITDDEIDSNAVLNMDDLEKYYKEDFPLWNDVTVTGEDVRKKVLVDSNEVENSNELEVGEYIAEYIVENAGGTVKKNRKIIIKDTTFRYTYKGYDEKFIAFADGYYSIDANGAQGNTDGGLGGNINGKLYLNKGDELVIYVGGIYYSYNVYSGGESTNVKKNDNYIIIAGGGGGKGNLVEENTQIIRESQGGNIVVNTINDYKDGNGSYGTNGEMLENKKECITTTLPNPDYKCEITYETISVPGVCVEYQQECNPAYCASYLMINECNTIAGMQICIPKMTDTCNAYIPEICSNTNKCIKKTPDVNELVPSGQKCTGSQLIEQETCYELPNIIYGSIGKGGVSYVSSEYRNNFTFTSGQNESYGNLTISFLGGSI